MKFGHAILVVATFVLGAACSKSGGGGTGENAAPAAANPDDGVPSIEIPANLTVSTDPATIAKGEQLFSSKGCTACHKIGGGKLVGPDLQGVTARRSTKWIARMILHPEVMVREDPTAKQLLATYMTPMSAQGVDPNNDLPAIISFLKSKEK